MFEGGGRERCCFIPPGLLDGILSALSPSKLGSNIVLNTHDQSWTLDGGQGGD